MGILDWLCRVGKPVPFGPTNYGMVIGSCIKIGFFGPDDCSVSRRTFSDSGLDFHDFDSSDVSCKQWKVVGFERATRF